MQYKLKKYESETVINYNLESDIVNFYTCDIKEIRRMDKLCLEFPELYKKVAEDEFSKSYEFSKRLLPKPRKPKILSKEQKEKMRERMFELKSKSKKKSQITT